MNLPDFKRLIRPIANKIFLLLGRAILKAVTNSGDRQLIQVTGLKGETITGVERFQEYGFETYPLVNAEAFIGFLNGNRDHGIACVVHDGRYRPTDLSSGEVAVYGYEDKTNPFRIQMKVGRIQYRASDKEEVEVGTSVTEDIGTSKIITVPLFIVDGSQVGLGGSDYGTMRKLVDERFKAVFDGHTHNYAAGVTDAPNGTLEDVHMTSITKAL